MSTIEVYVKRHSLKSRAAKKTNLVVVAHPDDETIYFGGLLLAERQCNWRVICVTDGNADGLGGERHAQFARACHSFGVKNFEFFDMRDRYDVRLPQAELRARLVELSKQMRPHTVYTHGPLGEYGHPHHQDVSLAVHEVFSDVRGVAYNCSPNQIVKLTTRQFEKKTNVLAEIYFGETSRFIQYLPATSLETFARFKLAEVRALHEFLSGGELSPPQSLDKYKWFRPYLREFREAMIKRPF